MKRKPILLTMLVLCFVASGLFAEGQREKDRDKTADPVLSGTITVKESISENRDKLYTQYQDSIVSTNDAATAATAAFPNTGVLALELENVNGFLVYTVRLSNGMEVFVDAGSGKVLASEKNKREDHDRSENETNREEESNNEKVDTEDED